MVSWLECDKGLKLADNNVLIEFVYPSNSQHADDLPELFLLYIDNICVSHSNILKEMQMLAEFTLRRREIRNL